MGIRLGVIVILSKNKNIRSEFKKAKELGFETCQLVCWDEQMFTDEIGIAVKSISEEFGVEITALWCGWDGSAIWNFHAGPVTLGLVPETYRFNRMKTLCKGSDFAKLLGVSHIITHVGFVPENPSDSKYIEVVEAVRWVADYCKRANQFFLFETGQETPVTLKRIIEDVGSSNLGINLDPANLLMYGKANPVDALDVFGEYVMGVHAKDGEYPKNGRELGQEKPLGQGRVDFHALIGKLIKLNYKGALTIEREIEGEEQIKDIIAGKEMLEAIINGG